MQAIPAKRRGNSGKQPANQQLPVFVIHSTDIHTVSGFPPVCSQCGGKCRRCERQRAGYSGDTPESKPERQSGGAAPRCEKHLLESI